MKNQKTREIVKQFVKTWESREGYEKGETQAFWLALLRDVFGIYAPERTIFFEEQVRVGVGSKTHTNFIDARIPKTKVFIEQKSRDVDLRAPAKQSDGSMRTPYEQVKKYADEAPYSEKPRWIVVSNFREFLVHDMERPHQEPISILLKDLPNEYEKLNFLVTHDNKKIVDETSVSIQAGEIVGKIYDALFNQYNDPESVSTQRSLNMLCVRIVFCLYAEDAGIFENNQFHDYLQNRPYDTRAALVDLFKVLDQRPEERDEYLADDLAAFPYVNGGLFRDQNLKIPQIPVKILTTILEDASEKFDWSAISPTIFGAVFESTLNPETRRQGGMHYTSIENIHKVIDPLFLDELQDEFNTICENKVPAKRQRRLAEFQEKLGSLTFLDPACGSGNFLTETYLSLRRLENAALRLIYPDGTLFSASDKEGVVKVSIDHFYGIEINDFAVSVAKTALWIAENQMLQETEGLLSIDLDFLPLKTNAGIVEANALRIDWNDVVPKKRLNYIMGNPPFVGYGLQTAEQKSDVFTTYVDSAGKTYKSAGKIDYVSCWYFKACKYIQGTNILAAFVSTNSITQGEQVDGVWKPIYSQFNIQIIFAHQTFRWDSEASLKAHVHCVIIGFTLKNYSKDKIIYTNKSAITARNINPYLLNAPNVWVGSISKPICNVPEMITGNRPTDGGHLIIESKDYQQFIKNQPESKKYIKRLVGSEEFINNKKRYCLWLVNVSPSELHSMPFVLKRVSDCREKRLSSPDPGCRKLADRPTQFREIVNPENYLLVPKVSSERRFYIPIGFMGKDTISTDLNFMVPDATLYHFGVLTSSVHMAWTRAVCGRLEMRYRYSAKIVYNNFPWPPTSSQHESAIGSTAQGILDARALYPDSSLAALYDDLTMPIELRKAHEANDKAVMKAYGFKSDMSESEIVAALMERYQQLTERR